MHTCKGQKWRGQRGERYNQYHGLSTGGNNAYIHDDRWGIYGILQGTGHFVRSENDEGYWEGDPLASGFVEASAG